MSHSFTWAQPTIAGAVLQYSTDAASGAQNGFAETPTDPDPPTYIRDIHDVNGLQGIVDWLAPMVRQNNPWGAIGQADANPDSAGTPRPLAKSAPVGFETIAPGGGGSTFTLKSTSDAWALGWQDWLIDEDGNPFDGLSILSPVQPGDWIEIDGYTTTLETEDGALTLRVIGRFFLITDVDWETGVIKTMEPNAPARNATEWEADEDHGPLGGLIWRMAEDPPAKDIGDPPILHVDATGDDGPYVNPSVSLTNLNIETRVCAHDRFVFAAIWDERASGGLGWVHDLLYLAAGDVTREAKTCASKDIRGRLNFGTGNGAGGESYVANSPFDIYPAHRRAQEARLGIEGPIVHMCDGGASANGGTPLCIDFTARVWPHPSVAPVTARQLELLNGFEVVGVQDVVGLPAATYSRVSTISIAGLAGHWWATAGGADGNNFVVLGATGSWGALVDMRADSAGLLAGILASALRRPQGLSEAEAKAISLVYRVLGDSRVYARTGEASLEDLPLDFRCDVTDGASHPGYSSTADGWGMDSTTNHYAQQVIRDTASFGGSRTVEIQPATGSGDLKITAPFYPADVAHAPSVLDITAAIAGVDGGTGQIAFIAEPSTPYVEHVVGHYAEWFEDTTAVEHNSVKQKVQPGDSMLFPVNGALGEFSGREFIVETASKDTVNEIDLITLLLPNGDRLTPSAGMVGITPTFRRARAFWWPDNDVVTVRQSIAGGAFEEMDSSAYQVDPCGRDTNGDGEPEWHVKIASPPAEPASYAITITDALLPVNFQRSPHINELRLLAENLDRAIVGLGTDIVDLSWWMTWFYQHGGADDPSYGYYTEEPYNGTVPHWGPTIFGPFAYPGPGAPYSGIDWEVGSPGPDPTTYITGATQTKAIHADVLVLPSNLHFPSASAIQEAYVWVKATAVGDLPDDATLSAQVVLRKKDKSQIWCSNIDPATGKCKGGPILTGGYTNPHTQMNGDNGAAFPGGEATYRNPEDDGNYAWTTTGKQGLALGVRSDLWDNGSITPADYDEEFCMEDGPRPYMRPVDPMAGGPPYSFLPEVDCTQENHDNGSLVCVHQSGGTETDYFVTSGGWSRSLGGSGETEIDGTWRKVYVTDALKAAMLYSADWDVGIMVGLKQAVNQTLDGPGAFVGVSVESGSPLPTVHWNEIPGGTFESGVSHGQDTYEARIALEAEPYLYLRFAVSSGKRLPANMNLPAIVAPEE